MQKNADADGRDKTSLSPEAGFGVDIALPPRLSLAKWFAVFGPGLLVMLADTDAGNIITAADAGTRWGFRLVPLPLLLIPALAAVQELAVRIGLFTGGGFADLVRQRCGIGLRILAGLTLVCATLGSLSTEFTGIAGVAELYGVSRFLVVPASGIGLLVILLMGKYRRVERIATVLGLFELGFVAIAWWLHPSLTTIVSDVADQRLLDSGYLYLVAALIGSTFNPWMIFYQASALAELRVGPIGYNAARWDTWSGAALTQCLTAAVVVAGAAVVVHSHETAAPIVDVGQISRIFEPVLGVTCGRLVFGLGVVGASLAAAIVCSLACVWGLGELVGLRGSLDGDSRQPWFTLGTIVFVAFSALVVLLIPDLVWLAVGLQVLNALLLPFVMTLLIVLSAGALPEAVRPRGVYLWLIVGAVAVISIAGLVGAVSGLF